MAIVMNLEEDNVGCVLLGTTSGIKEGMVVKRTKRIASIRVNDNMLGRVINPLGQAIDGKGDIDLSDAFEMPLDRKAPGVIYRQPVKEPLQTGLKAIDSMIPIGRGQRELIIGDRQTGKTTPSSYQLRLLILLLCSIMHRLLVLPSVNISAIVVCLHLWSMTTSLSRLWPIVRYH